ncbi:hypothetical protein JW935_03865 [candidate division KSB1 bacterium]|nr:hypothetical protein [candidate division KSB1 bacterium]
MKKSLNITRFIIAILFLTGAMINTIFLISSPHVFKEFAVDAFLPIYKQLWSSLVYPHLTVFVGLVALFELSLTILLLSKGVKVKTGFILATVFMPTLVPFWWFGFSPVNLVFAIVFVWLSRFCHTESIGDYFRGIFAKR